MSAQIAARVATIDRMLAAHAGGLELQEVRGGEVRVAYTGMCTGCPLRPLTTTATVRPALLALPDVTSVHVAGGRISTEAEQRLAAALGPAASRWSAGAPCLPGDA
jgi:Fe-S cluster biogenesis protein NfuA